MTDSKSIYISLLSTDCHFLYFQDHDPGSFGDEVAARSREALEIRYELLPYLYTLFYQANKYGSTVVRSLQFQ